MTNPGVAVMTASPGTCPEIRCQGRTYRVGYPTQDAKGRLERLVQKAVLDRVRVLKGVLDPAAYDELFTNARKGLGDYLTWRPGWQAEIADPANGHLFFWALLQEHHPQVTEAEVVGLLEAAPEEVELAVAQVVPDFFTLLAADLTRALAAIRADLEKKGELTPEKAALLAQAEAEAGRAVAALRARLTPSPRTPSAA